MPGGRRHVEFGHCSAEIRLGRGRLLQFVRLEFAVRRRLAVRFVWGFAVALAIAFALVPIAPPAAAAAAATSSFAVAILVRLAAVVAPVDLRLVVARCCREFVARSRIVFERYGSGVALSCGFVCGRLVGR